MAPWLVAARFVRDLRENADAYHVGAIAHALFVERNAAIWRDVEAAGARAAVVDRLREAFNDYPEIEERNAWLDGADSFEAWVDAMEADASGRESA